MIYIDFEKAVGLLEKNHRLRVMVWLKDFLAGDGIQIPVHRDGMLKGIASISKGEKVTTSFRWDAEIETLYVYPGVNLDD